MQGDLRHAQLQGQSVQPPFVRDEHTAVGTRPTPTREPAPRQQLSDHLAIVRRAPLGRDESLLVQCRGDLTRRPALLAQCHNSPHQLSIITQLIMTRHRSTHAMDAGESA
jgi:hypothetical protein